MIKMINLYVPSLGYEDNEFVGKVKNKISRQNRIGLNILGISGIAFSIFLIVASVNSGEAFAYAGIILFIVSIIFIIGVNMKFKQHDYL
ncbi:hypothetical protein HMJ28_03055 [Clostridium cochlearium]|uniref:Uncharacterized protein n=2 Tax=Clostridium cochlearium TaxID=1494 RepID=A0A7Y3V628_CLOCO|nr:hypothetical protein [Clostridium cochlearium]